MKFDIGYYQVGDHFFDNKLDAVLFAQKTNSNVSWNFFDDTFEKINWNIESELSIIDLYRIRAQQIREKYDYVIVFCSGGSDSNNVIRTFIDNNIHVDEVIGIAPVSGLNNWDFDQNNFNEDNTITETKFALFPLLNEISKKSPSTKITINDYFADLLKTKDNNWFYESCGNIVTTLTSQFTNISKFKHIDKLLQSNKKIGLVYGTDKPIVRLVNNDFFFIFADSGVNYLNMSESNQYPTVDRVLFYWSPDLPELLVKQSHMIAKASVLTENKNLLELLKPDTTKKIASGSFYDFIEDQTINNQDPISKKHIFEKYTNVESLNYNKNFSKKTIYQRTIAPLIYPNTFDKNLFQCQKVDADQGFFTKDQNWIHQLHKKTKISDMVNSAIYTVYNSISPKFLNYQGTGFINYFKIYKFGTLKNFVK
jgi:hypothetical protein